MGILHDKTLHDKLAKSHLYDKMHLHDKTSFARQNALARQGHPWTKLKSSARRPTDHTTKKLCICSVSVAAHFPSRHQLRGPWTNCISHEMAPGQIHICPCVPKSCGSRKFTENDQNPYETHSICPRRGRKIDKIDPSTKLNLSMGPSSGNPICPGVLNEIHCSPHGQKCFVLQCFPRAVLSPVAASRGSIGIFPGDPQLE